MDKIIFENCIIFRSNSFEEVISALNEYDKEGTTVLIKFSKNFGFNLIMDKLRLDEINSGVGKQSRVIINNIKSTRYKLDKDIKDLNDVDIEQFSSKEIMLVKNISNGNYYILDKVFYNREESFTNLKDNIIEEVSRLYNNK